jgi:hypothetical protein
LRRKCAQVEPEQVQARSAKDITSAAEWPGTTRALAKKDAIDAGNQLSVL